jgi:hypothetical protein
MERAAATSPTWLSTYATTERTAGAEVSATAGPWARLRRGVLEVANRHHLNREHVGCRDVARPQLERVLCQSLGLVESPFVDRAGGLHALAVPFEHGLPQRLGQPPTLCERGRRTDDVASREKVVYPPSVRVERALAIALLVLEPLGRTLHDGFIADERERHARLAARRKPRPQRRVAQRRAMAMACRASTGARPAAGTRRRRVRQGSSVERPSRPSRRNRSSRSSTVAVSGAASPRLTRGAFATARVARDQRAATACDREHPIEDAPPRPRRRPCFWALPSASRMSARCASSRSSIATSASGSDEADTLFGARIPTPGRRRPAHTPNTRVVRVR